MDGEQIKASLLGDFPAGLKTVTRQLMTTEDEEAAQGLGDLLSGADDALYTAAQPGAAPAEHLAGLFDALCTSGYVDTAVSSLIALFRNAKASRDAAAPP